MIQCPSCRAMIPDDSAFCDQCGTELMWCPECKRPKPNRGRECPVCGSDLIPGKIYLNNGVPQPNATSQHGISSATNDFTSPQAKFIPPQPVETQQHQTSAPQGTVVNGGPSEPTKIIGNGWTLTLREGQFGRTSGIYPEFASCKYISGNHGKFMHNASGWMVIDNGSTNGTYINDVKLAPGTATPLHIGDKLTIATIDFDVQ